jgi:hypothetical protein
VGYLDKISAQEVQQEQDELLLHMENFSAESNEEPIDDDDDVPPSSNGPTVPPPAHEHNVSVPTPGIH